MRRGLVVAVLLCLAGGALLLLVLSRTWLEYGTAGQAPLPGVTVTVSGAQLVPGARALALLGLAAAAALPATRSWGRQLVGLVVALAGAGAVALLVRALADTADAAMRTEQLRLDVHFADAPDLGGWPYVGLLGALLLVAAGVLTLVRGRTWSALGASYDAPTAPKETSAWDALDHGVDPTA
jgi:uncharacterized membrane protein (TIGR02234 family)